MTCYCGEPATRFYRVVMYFGVNETPFPVGRCEGHSYSYERQQGGCGYEELTPEEVAVFEVTVS